MVFKINHLSAMVSKIRLQIPGGSHAFVFWVVRRVEALGAYIRYVNLFVQAEFALLVCRYLVRGRQIEVHLLVDFRPLRTH